MHDILGHGVESSFYGLKRAALRLGELFLQGLPAELQACKLIFLREGACALLQQLAHDEKFFRGAHFRAAAMGEGLNEML